MFWKNKHQQNILIKRQNKRLQKILVMLESLHKKLDTLSLSVNPPNNLNPENGAFDAATKLRKLQTEMDSSLAGTIVDQPVRVD